MNLIQHERVHISAYKSKEPQWFWRPKTHTILNGVHRVSFSGDTERVADFEDIVWEVEDIFIPVRVCITWLWFTIHINLLPLQRQGRRLMVSHSFFDKLKNAKNGRAENSRKKTAPHQITAVCAKATEGKRRGAADPLH